jgi:hypothetical protein
MSALSRAAVLAVALFAAPRAAHPLNEHGARPPMSPPPAATVAAASPLDETIPPAEDGAKAALERSPRHGEWLDVKTGSGAPIRTDVVVGLAAHDRLPARAHGPRTRVSAACHRCPWSE